MKTSALNVSYVEDGPHFLFHISSHHLKKILKIDMPLAFQKCSTIKNSFALFYNNVCFNIHDCIATKASATNCYIVNKSVCILLRQETGKNKKINSKKKRDTSPGGVSSLNSQQIIR